MSKLSKELHMWVADQWIQGNAQSPVAHYVWGNSNAFYVQVGERYKYFTGASTYDASRMLIGAGWWSKGAKRIQEVLQGAKPEQVNIAQSAMHPDEIYVNAEELYKWSRMQYLKYKKGNSPALFLLAAYRAHSKRKGAEKPGSTINALRDGIPLQEHPKSNLSSAQAEAVIKRSQKLNTLLLHRDLANALEAVNRVLHWGCNERQPPYPETGWKDVPLDKYKQALLRHQSEWLKDPAALDDESGKLHLAHLATNALILLQRWPEEGKSGSSNH